MNCFQGNRLDQLQLQGCLVYYPNDNLSHSSQTDNMQTPRLTGLIAATYTPMNQADEISLEVIPPYVDFLLDRGIKGLYVCGSTGEGMSLSSSERRAVTEAFVRAADGRVPVIVQVGHNSLKEAKELARHAASAGADIISATCPSYFKVSDLDTLIHCMAEVASGAPDLPFYYYHIPALTGSEIDMVTFLEKASEAIPNLKGLKYTDTRLFEFQQCCSIQHNAFDVVWGCDEMLLGALATGAKAAIGSTYNIASPLYEGIIDAMELGNSEQARSLQADSVKMIRTLCQFPFHSAMKSILTMQGLPMGQCRLPQVQMKDGQITQLRACLAEFDFLNLT